MASFMFVWEVMLRGCGLFHVCLGGYVERLWPLSCLFEVVTKVGLTTSIKLVKPTLVTTSIKLQSNLL